MDTLQSAEEVRYIFNTASTFIWSRIFGDGDSDWSDEAEVNASIIGIIVAISGNVVISLALNCQKLAHRRLEREREQKRTQRGEGVSDSTTRRPSLGQRRTSNNSYASLREVDELEIDDREEVNDDDDERTRVGQASYYASPDSEDESDYGETIPFPGRSSPSPQLNSWSLRERAHSLLLETEPLLVVSPEGQSPRGSVRATYGSRSRAQSFEETHRGKKRKGRNLLAYLFRGSKGKNKATVDLDIEEAEAIPVQIHQTANGSSTTSRKPFQNKLNFVDSKPNRHEEFESDYLKSKLWWFGFFLMIVGELGNFISYAFAPASVVAPLGTFALIANCFFAPLMLKEKVRKSDLFGVGLAILGAITVVLSASPSDTRLDPEGLIHAISQTAFIILGSVYGVGATILVGLSSQPAGSDHVYIDVGACALFGGFTVLATKATSSLITLEGGNVVKEWIIYPVLAVLIVTGVGQIRYLNRALMKFDSKVVIPTQFVLFNLSVIISSAVLYGDFRKATLHQMVTFFYGCGATFAGVFLLTWGNMGRSNDDGSIGREQNEGDRVGRAQITLPSTPHRPSRARPVLRGARSSVSLLGLSPAQKVLLVRSTSPTPEGEDGEEQTSGPAGEGM